MAAKFLKNSKSNCFLRSCRNWKSRWLCLLSCSPHVFTIFFITRTITYIFISVIYLSIFYEIGLLTHNVINYVLLLLQCFDWKSFIRHRLFIIACQGIGPKFRVKTINEPKMKNKFISKVNFLIFFLQVFTSQLFA